MFKKPLALTIAALLAAPSMAEENPYAKPDDSWISLSGKAVAADSDSFVLDYGPSTVLVEMDDWDWYGDNHGVIEGDNVTVYGEVDDDLFETTSIEAGSVYVENLGTYFYANSADEEGPVFTDWMPTPAVALGEITITGTVTSVTGREFTINFADQQVKVDTIAMSYDPTDDVGFQQIDKGDVVTVTGEMDYDTFEKREIMADSIVTLDDSGKS